MFDKLMMFLGTTMVTVGGGFSAMALQDSPRKMTFQIIGMILSAIGGAALLFSPKVGSTVAKSFIPMLALLSFAVPACGGTPTADATIPNICAMNPIAASCGEQISKNESALYSFGPAIHTEHFASNWSCGGPLDVVRFNVGSMMSVHPASFFGQYVGDTYGVEFGRSPSEGLSLIATTIPLKAAMDGPYHVLYNDFISGAGMLAFPGITSSTAVTPSGWYKNPVSIPAYGIWIYAAGERADYPTGVAVITYDPMNNPVSTSYPDEWSGRCDYRVQFVVAL